MEFFIKNDKPEFANHFQIGMQITFTDGIQGTVTKIEGEKVFLALPEEQAERLQSTYEEKAKSRKGPKY
ncbi:hypothetical protein ABWK22_02455 [Gottfriedia acidiceleris]|uniref:hypothetical protein n=1 Tax=Gottfriedia acidiceleris TaxID=371036 RepID=UPI003391F3F1